MNFFFLIKFFASLIIINLIFPPKIFASQNFLVDYGVLYQIQETGNANATLNASITNNNGRYFISDYKIKTGFENINNLKGFDEEGPLKFNVVKNADGKEIEVIFNKKKLGKGNKTVFSLSFTTPDAAKKTGNNWEINIPGIADKDEFSSFNVKLEYPPAFGTPSYVKPKTESKDLFFTKDELEKSPISIGFGEKQFYKFELTYMLENKNIFPVEKEIAIPPATNYQDVIIEKINPLPKNVYEDKDGNWMANFSLLPSQKITVDVSGKAITYLHPKKELLTKVNEKYYLEEKKFWEQSSSTKKAVSTLKTTADIYEFVVKTLKYDFSRVKEEKPRVGAGNILKNPNSSVCLEFTDLFIALSRALGIPAREVDGFAYTQNLKQRPLSLKKDILHAWPEYYDYKKNTWIMVDPTWGNTTKGVDYFNTLDFYHLAFVKRGRESTYPVPPGGSRENAKDIQVDFTGEMENPLPTIEVSADFPQNSPSFLPVYETIIIKNTGKVLFPSSSVKVEAEGLMPSESKISFNNIPPFGFIKIPVSLKSPLLLTKSKVKTRITIEGKQIENSINLSPVNKETIIAGGVLGVLFIIVLSIALRRAGRLFFSGRKR